MAMLTLRRESTGAAHVLEERVRMAKGRQDKAAGGGSHAGIQVFVVQGGDLEQTGVCINAGAARAK